MKGIFQVYRKDSIHYDKNIGDFIGTIEEVFNIRDDKCGYPHFLIHSQGEWKYESAKNFVPDINDVIINKKNLFFHN